jgi:hypothetical protein
MEISPEYFVQKFYQYAGYVHYKNSTAIYEGGCPTCREGKSWGRKRRLYYMTRNNYIHCHNCGWTGNPVKWVMEVAGMTYKEILEEVESGDYMYLPMDSLIKNDGPKFEVSTLPEDSINLFDDLQTSFYKNETMVKKALEFIKERRLDTAINRPLTMWISLKDFIHKNRLVIPFYSDGEIAWYQSRALLPEDAEDGRKYISKIGSHKIFFNIDKVEPDASEYFIFEGPIDACFVKNAVALGGINENSKKLFTNEQMKQIGRLFFKDRTWVLDSQWQDKAAHRKTMILIEKKEKVFIWPDAIGKIYKDFNDITIKAKLNEIAPDFIRANTFDGLKAKMIMSKIPEPA